MTKIEGSTKIVNFMTPRAGVLMSGVTICHYSEYVLSFTLSIYSTLIAIVLFIMMLLTYSIRSLIFQLFYDGAVDIHLSLSDKKSV